MFNITNTQIRLNGDKLHQTDRNQLRTHLLSEVQQLLTNQGVECAIIKEGIAVNVPHNELGAINFVLDVKMKDLNFDYDFEVEDYQKEQEAKAKKAEANAKAKASKIAADKARREAQRQA